MLASFACAWWRWRWGRKEEEGYERIVQGCRVVAGCVGLRVRFGGVAAEAVWIAGGVSAAGECAELEQGNYLCAVAG